MSFYTTIYSMKLVIVESPSKAKTIEKYLGDNYTVLSSIGHICELPKSESKAINIENDFKPCYEVIKGKEKIIFQLKEIHQDGTPISKTVLASPYFKNSPTPLTSKIFPSLFLIFP